MNKSNSTKLTCRDTTYLVCSARDTPLEVHQRQLLDEHLATCAACQVASRQFADLFGQLDVLFAREEADEKNNT